jgi:transcriptional regulator with XRE-family HTH domain
MEEKTSHHIGKNIKRLREKHHLTLSFLAEKCGVTRHMLMQIESEKVNPTIATVWKIARGLDVDIDSLLSGQEHLQRTFDVSRGEDITRMETDEEGVHIRVLSPLAMADDLEMYILSFREGSSLPSSPHAARSEEFLTVLKGAVRVKAGENIAELQEGDFIRYHADVEHTIENINEGKSEIYMVVRFQGEQA